MFDPCERPHALHYCLERTTSVARREHAGSELVQQQQGMQHTEQQQQQDQVQQQQRQPW